MPTCPACRGTGRGISHNYRCEDCNGRGTITLCEVCNRNVLDCEGHEEEIELMKRPNIESGPWAVVHQAKGLIGIEHGNACVCTMDHDAEDKDFCETHARTIAAVPQLLEALEQAFNDPNTSIGTGQTVKAAMISAGYTF